MIVYRTMCDVLAPTKRNALSLKQGALLGEAE